MLTFLFVTTMPGSRYWPAVLYNDEEKIGDETYDGINVRVQAGYRKDGYITSKLLVSRGQETREISHFWFDAWPGECAYLCSHRRSFCVWMCVCVCVCVCVCGLHVVYVLCVYL